MLNKLIYQIIILLTFSSSLLYSQSDSPTFPESWLGKWKGDLYIDQAGKGTVQQLTMELHVQDLEQDSTWQWKIIYRTDSSTDERDYLLKLVDSSEGHYVIDEQNGIELDSFWFDPVFSSRFIVSGQILLISYTQKEQSLAFEVHAGGAKPLQETDWSDSTGTAPIHIESLPLKIRQHARLTRYE